MQQKVPFIVAELGPDVDPFMHIYAALAEKERGLISERTQGGAQGGEGEGRAPWQPRGWQRRDRPGCGRTPRRPRGRRRWRCRRSNRSTSRGRACAPSRGNSRREAFSPRAAGDGARCRWPTFCGERNRPDAGSARALSHAARLISPRRSRHSTASAEYASPRGDYTNLKSVETRLDKRTSLSVIEFIAPSRISTSDPTCDIGSRAPRNCRSRPGQV